MWKQNKNASSPLTSLKKKKDWGNEIFLWEMLGWKCISDFWNSKYSSLRPLLGEAEKEVNGA